MVNDNHVEQSVHSASQFYLKKWYVDAADEQGQLYIGYWAVVSWRNRRFHIYQQLWHTPDSGVKSHTYLTKQSPPAWNSDHQLCWRPSETQAMWQSVANPLCETLLTNEQGTIQWLCHQPQARAAVSMPNFSLQGWGYTECIEVTIPPWRLPFQTLYWGRCHTTNHYLVWINWNGETPGRFLWHNGRLIHDWYMADCLPQSPTLHLTIDRNFPLRQGNLKSTVFSSFRKLTNFFPRTAFLVDEQKWFALGRLETDAAVEPATIIYEKVSW